MTNESRKSLLIGIHSVEAALESVPGQVSAVLVAEECRNPRVLKLTRKARAEGVPVRQESRVVLDSRSDGQRHQDVVAEFEARNIHGEKALPGLLQSIEGPAFILVLDGVQDPHNLGACLRSAEAAGVHLVILPKDRAAGLTPVARRAASGAAEVLPIVIAPNLARVLRTLKDEGIWLAGTSDAATTDLYQADLSGPLALVMGSEGQGMRRLTTDLCDFLLSIPMQGSVNSLNVSVATAVALFEAVRQRTMTRTRE